MPQMTAVSSASAIVLPPLGMEARHRLGAVVAHARHEYTNDLLEGRYDPWQT